MSRVPCPWPIAELVPQSGPMVLLDEAIEFDDLSLVARVTIRPEHPFFDGTGVPVHVGIELMAQTCGACVGAASRTKGEPIKPGLLLGTRNFAATDEYFRAGDRLQVLVTMAFRDEQMGVFDCQIGRGNDVVATAQLTVYQPKDAASLVEMMTGSHG